MDIDIIDDDELLRELYSTILEVNNYTVNSYESAEQYLSYVNSQNYLPPNIAVFTDVQMAGKSGYELIHEIKKKCPQQRFVVITGEPSEGKDKDGCACVYLSKPVEISKFETVLEALTTCANNLDYKQSEPCKHLSDFSRFGIKNWKCPLKN